MFENFHQLEVLPAISFNQLTTRSKINNESRFFFYFFICQECVDTGEGTHITHKATDKGLVCKSLICFEYCNKKKALSERKTERVRDGVRL